MEFLKNFNPKTSTILKVFGIIVLALIALSIAFSIINSAFFGFSQDYRSYESADYGHSAGMALKSVAPEISARNVLLDKGYDHEESAQFTEENFEITEFSSSIETRKLEETCQALSNLKAKDYVIFENANEDKNNCYYRFKVKKEKQDEIVGIIENYNPKNFNENTQTIKQRIDDFTSEIEILEKKEKSINETLNNAINSYNEISKIATETRDAESLSKIIDSKIKIIERLTEEKIEISEQLDRIGRAKAEQLDRLNYSYFNVSVFENKYFDIEYIKDSWKRELKRFVNDINRIFQDSTIGLIKLIFNILQVALYFLVLLITAKFGWKIVKKIWQK